MDVRISQSEFLQELPSFVGIGVKTWSKPLRCLSFEVVKWIGTERFWVHGENKVDIYQVLLTLGWWDCGRVCV